MTGLSRVIALSCLLAVLGLAPAHATGLIERCRDRLAAIAARLSRENPPDPPPSLEQALAVLSPGDRVLFGMAVGRPAPSFGRDRPDVAQLTALGYPADRVEAGLRQALMWPRDAEALGKLVAEVPEGDRLLVIEGLNLIFRERERKIIMDRLPVEFGAEPVIYMPKLMDELQALAPGARLDAVRKHLETLRRTLRGGLDSLFAERPVMRFPPDEASMGTIERLQALKRENPGLEALSADERRWAEGTLAAWERFLDREYSGPNAFLRSYRISEIEEPRPVSLSPADFVASGRFRETTWWLPSLSMVKESLAVITGKSTRSLLKKAKDEAASREIFWIRKSPRAGSDYPVLDRARIAINRDGAGNETSLEILVRGEDGRWRAGYYVKVSETWVPQRTLDGKPIQMKCLECHKGSNGGLSPRPIQLKTREDFEKVGYKDPHLIDELMKYGDE